MKFKYDTFAEDIRRIAPEWADRAGAGLARQLPIKGLVRSPDGVVHNIIGDLTWCVLQWATYSRREGMSFKVTGWELCDDAPTCLVCVTDS